MFNCNTDFETTPHMILKHPVCKNENEAKRTRAAVEKRIQKKNPHLVIVGEYRKQKSKVLFKCTIHDYIFPSSVDSMLRAQGLGCLKCNAEKLSKERMLSEKEFEEKLALITPSIEVIGEYRGTSNRIGVRCKKCGEEWSPYASNLLSGYGWANCKGNKKLTVTEWRKRVKLSNPYIKITGKYTNIDTPIETECKLCGGKDWKPTPYQLIRGDRCPCCNKYQTSSVQNFIYLVFQNALGVDAVLSRDTETIGMELDIIIPEYKVAFEPGSWYYHKNKIEHDKKKRILCKEKGIRLYTVYFGNDIEINDVDENVILVNNDLNVLQERIKICNFLASKVGIELNFEYQMYQKLDYIARNMSKNTVIRLREKLKQKNSFIDLVDGDIGVENKYLCTCKKCGTKKELSKDALINRKYCWNKECEYSYSAFQERISYENFIGKYVVSRKDLSLAYNKQNDSNHIYVICRRCGEIWNATKQSLRRGTKHACNGKQNGKMKTTERFVDEMKFINPQIIILGDYKGAQEYIEYTYKGDSKIYKAYPDSLLHGHGAAEKAGNKKLTTVEFVKRMENLHPYLVVKGEYTGRRNKIECGCKKCGNIFMRHIDTLYKNSLKCDKCKAKL